MALTLLAANNAQTVLAAGISSSATSITVNTGTGALFPSPVFGTSYFKLTLVDAATGSLTEIVHVTARSGDVMTIQRGQEGTTARAWSANDLAANMMTAGTLDVMAQKDLSLQIANSLSEIAAAGTAPQARGYLGLGDAAKYGVATIQQMQAGTATDLLPTVAAVMSLFSKRSFGQNDFIRIPDVPGGLIVQWGKSGGADASGLIKINLPTTFPNTFQNAQAIYFSPNRRSIVAQTASLTATELQLWASYANTDTAAAGASLWWIAIGN